MPRGFGHIHAVERAWDTVLWDQARRDGAAFFHHREGPNGAGRPSLIYVVYLCFWKKRKWICSLLPKNFNPSWPSLANWTLEWAEHRHQTLSQFPPLGAPTFACICSFLSLDLRGFCRIPSICRKGAKRAHGQGDETDWKDAKAEMWPSSGPGVSTVPLVIWIKRRFYVAWALFSPLLQGRSTILAQKHFSMSFYSSKLKILSMKKWWMQYSDRLPCWPSDWLTNWPTNKERYISRCPSLPIDYDPCEYDLWFFNLKAKFWPMSIRLKAKIVIFAAGPAFRRFDKGLMTVFHIFWTFWYFEHLLRNW